MELVLTEPRMILKFLHYWKDTVLDYILMGWLKSDKIYQVKVNEWSYLLNWRVLRIKFDLDGRATNVALSMDVSGMLNQWN